MQYIFEEVKVNFPKSTSRSNRTKKKLHIGEYAETLVSINLTADTFDTPYEDQLLDAMYEFDSGMFVGSNGDGTIILAQLKSSEVNEDKIKKYCEDLLFVLSDIEPKFAEIGTIAVQYGDAYYGEW
jgi:uncharacterized protein YggL (DUF469 family)